MQQPGVSRYRANPVAWQRQHLAMQQSAAQLDLVGGDAVAGGEPPQHADRDGQHQRQDHPPRIAGRRPENQGADHQGQLAQHLMYRVHQQHARVQAHPVRRAIRAGMQAHVASCAPIAAISVSWATTRSATSESSASMRTAPADDAVVTVTLASPNNRSSGPR